MFVILPLMDVTTDELLAISTMSNNLKHPTLLAGNCRPLLGGFKFVM